MKVGFIGLGRMGRGMAANLQKAGFDMVVHDLSRAAATPFIDSGARWADSAEEVAAASDVVFTSLPTPTDVENIANSAGGLATGFREGSAWFDLSTNSVPVVRRLHAQLAEQGIAFLDAPVSGGPAGAASGDLAIWVGGDKTVADSHWNLLEAMSDKTSYLGPIGAGTIAKLAHNTASAAIGAVMAEVLTMGVKAGLEPLALWGAMRQGAAGRRRSFDGAATRFMQGRLDPPSFQLRLVHKDVRLTLELADELDVPMRLCELLLGEITEAMERGWGSRDSQSFLLLQQERAGVPPIQLSAEDVKSVMERT